MGEYRHVGENCFRLGDGIYWIHFLTVSGAGRDNR